MNVQPKLCQPPMMTAPGKPAARARGPAPGPATVLGIPDGRVLALGEVP